MSLSKRSSSPMTNAWSTPQEELVYYKTQYYHLAAELEEFQETSKELEAELERDAEAAEKREEKFKSTIEILRFEVDEWKTKHKQYKSQANIAQNDLQKEITSLRDINRSLNLQLRDLEVANDDYERQARNTTSSLDDLESRYDSMLERNILLEEEIRMGEQEREMLRIEVQRQRDELNDLRIEIEVTESRLRSFGTTKSALVDGSLPRSSARSIGLLASSSEHSLQSASSAAENTPVELGPESSILRVSTSLHPSTVVSKASATSQPPTTGPAFPVQKITSTTSRENPQTTQNKAQRNVRYTKTFQRTPGNGPPTFSRHELSYPTRVNDGIKDGPPRSGSLYQIRGLMGKMQKLEERVQSVKAQLPAPGPLPSDRSYLESDDMINEVTESVTVRRSSRRPSEIGQPTITRLNDLEEGRGSVRGTSLIRHPTGHSKESNGAPHSLVQDEVPRSKNEIRTAVHTDRISTKSESSVPDRTVYAGSHSRNRMLHDHQTATKLGTETIRVTSRRTTLDRNISPQDMPPPARPLAQGQPGD